MTWEAWREGLRRTAVDQGWRETASQPEVLEFVKDDLGVAMTIEARPSDGAFALTQRAVRIVTVPVTRKQVIEQFSRATAEVSTVTRVQAKLMTRGEFERVQVNGGSAGVDRTVWVWVVAVAGQVTPQFGHGSIYPSATYLVDAITGSVIGLNADNESWPAYFDSLPDHGAP